MEFKDYVILAALAFFVVAIGNGQGWWAVGVQPTTPTVTQVPGTTSCGQTSVTMTHGSYTAWGTPGTTLTLANGVLWYKNGAYQGTATMGATTTVAPGDTIVEIAGSDASTTSSPYSGKAIQATVPCGTFSLVDSSTGYSIAGYNHIGKISEMIVNGTMTLDVINGDTGNINAVDIENETVGANDEGKVTLRLKANSYQGLSPYGSLILVVESNNTAYNLGDFKMSKNYLTTTVPQAYTRSLDGQASQVIAFKIPGCPAAGNLLCDEDLGMLVFKSKSQDVATNMRGGLNLTVYQEEFDLNTQVSGLSGIMFGVEDNTGALSGPAGQTRQVSIG